jgi:hypothetical protein
MVLGVMVMIVAITVDDIFGFAEALALLFAAQCIEELSQWS